MKVEESEGSKTNPGSQIRLGVSSWDDKDKSAKYGWLDKNGKISRGGEVPVQVLPQMVSFAIRKGYLEVTKLETELMEAGLVLKREER